MARRPSRKNPEQLRKQLLGLIEGFEQKLKQDDLRKQVVGLIPAHHTLSDLGCSLLPDDNGESARARILAYLRKFPRTVIHGNELMVVAGISEYARRIRELRVQEGWPIVSGLTLKQMLVEGEASVDGFAELNMADLKSDAYILLQENADREAAHRWNAANRIRKSSLSIKDKFISFFRANVGNAISGEELRYLAKDASEWARRVRELRTEEGWPIATRTSGHPELPVGFYVLEEDRQSPPHDRVIPDPVRVSVLERDHHQCKQCEWSYEKKRKGDPRVLLELHHIEHHEHGGSNTPENLITLCNVCHDSVHRGDITAEELHRLLA